MCIPMPLSPNTGLRHQRRDLPVLAGDVADDEAHVLDVVRGGDQAREPGVDLRLARRAHLVVVGVDLHMEVVGEDVAHLAAQPLEGVEGGRAVVSLLEPGGPQPLGGVPRGLAALDHIAGTAPGAPSDGVGGREEADAVEDEELDLGAPVQDSSYPAAARDSTVRCAMPLGSWESRSCVPPSSTSQMNRSRPVGLRPGDRGEGGGVGPQDHVRLEDLAKAADRGAVELGDPLGERFRSRPIPSVRGGG